MMYRQFRPIRALMVSSFVGVLSISSVAAKPTAAEIERLGAELTPVGAERAGNKDGSIPQWDGGLKSPPANWDPSEGYIDPFSTDQPKFTITAKNAAQYQSMLTAGQQALLSRYPDFAMRVYPTRRTAGYPDAVNDAVKKFAGTAEVSGEILKNLGATTVPFPIPTTGLEVMWNQRLRYIGGVVERRTNWVPVQPNGEPIYRVSLHERIAARGNLEGAPDDLLLAVRARFLAPGVFSGSEILVNDLLEPGEDSRNWWVFNDGQKRVRRVPTAGYDDMPVGTEGLRTRDQYDGFNGSFDRYQWRLMGKKEIFVPYNNYALSNKKLNRFDLYRNGTINAELMRYELHRVWVVEATVKQGMRHAYPRRTFYIDEDSWNVVSEDSYDGRGSLWRVALHGVIQFYDAQVPWLRVSVWHDLTNGGYYVAGLDNDIKEPWKFGLSGKFPDFQPEVFSKKETVK